MQPYVSKREDFVNMLNIVDQDATAKLFLSGAATADYYMGLLQEVAVRHGFDLRKDTVMLHPEYIPDHLTKEIIPGLQPVIVSRHCPDGRLMFILGG
jgi:hypothetical protein